MSGTFIWFLISTRKVNELKKLRRVTLKTGLVAGAAVIVSISIFPHNTRRFSEIICRDVYHSVFQTLKFSDWEPGKEKPSGGVDWHYNNIQTRVLLWKYAIGQFISSPLVGIGFARYNDTDLEYSGIPHIVYLATGGQRYHGARIEMTRNQMVIISPAMPIIHTCTFWPNRESRGWH
jgi:hypothetical protein